MLSKKVIFVTLIFNIMEAESCGENTAYTSVCFFLISAELITNFQFHTQMAPENGKLMCVKTKIHSPQYAVLATVEVQGLL
jgi:hypothetical protein